MARTVITAFLGICLLYFARADRIRFDNYRVYTITPQSDGDLQVLKDLDGSSDSLRFLNDIEIPKKNVNIVVAPHKEPDFLEVLQEHDINYELVETNLQRIFDEETVAIPYATGQYDWTRYYTVAETYNWLKSLAQKYPSQVILLNGGKSYEGREILGVKVSYKPGNKGIFVEGGIHAREWIAPATVTYILNQLLTSTDPGIRNIAENYDWYFFPHANPDGYAYSMTTDRLWRKTRSRNGMCFGADPNRNWDFHWNEVGSSSNPCSDTFAGPSAFSEIETRTLANYVTSLKDKIQIYLAFHAYSQLLLFPYGYTRQHAPNHYHLQQIGDEAARALSLRYGTRYTVGNIYETIYPASGASMEWAYGKLNIPVAYTYELRPRNNVWNGFVLPPQQIIPTSQETMDSIVALVNESKRLGY